MRVALVALVLLLASPAQAQDRISAVTVATGYATGFEAGAVHNEIRLRAPISEHVVLEPMASWTQGFSYGADVLVPPCGPEGEGCYYGYDAFRTDGARAVALGSALTYRVAEALPLGLDGAHAGMFAQAVYPIWSGKGQRVGLELGADARLAQLVRVGADVQAAYFTAEDGGRERFSLTPLVRLAVGP